MKFVKLFETFVQEVKSKNQLKKELWHKNNPDPKGTILSIDDLEQYDIPDKIKSMMSKWDIIYKSPYGKSFYSESNISWSHKPDRSYRVSDHWNFKSSRDSVTHCKTDIKVPDNTHYSIGIYDRSKNIYNILLSEPTSLYIKRIDNFQSKLKHLKDPDTIYRKTILKDRISNREVYIKLEYDDKLYSGVVRKYTGGELKIEDESGELIFSTVRKQLNMNKVKYLILSDAEGNKIKNEFV